MHVAVIGSGAAGLSCAWLLAKNHHVVLLEQSDRLGGHANTQSTTDINAPQIDTGFIVYNEPSYPNLTAWFDNMRVQTEKSNMSFAVSRDGGNFEYAGGPPLGLFAQPSLLFRRRYYSMLRDLLRFYRSARNQISTHTDETLGEFLTRGNYSKPFLDDHLMPFAAAIWSASTNTMLEYPAAAFIRFCDNHGLLQLTNRPQWRTVSGGSRMYVGKVERAIGESNIKTNFTVSRVTRHDSGVVVESSSGDRVNADHVVIATHADQALAMLDTPTIMEKENLGAFSYESNYAVLHTDKRFMPVRKRAWCSWNYVESKAVQGKVCVSYWMNLLQNLASSNNYFVTLNPAVMPGPEYIVSETEYQHPVFNSTAMAAQKKLWQLQGERRTWFCGSYFGSGFHEDAVQSGLAVAEQLGGASRPWELDTPSNRIIVTEAAKPCVAAMELT